MDKDQLVQNELQRLERLFCGVDDNKKEFIRRQIEQLAWYNVSIAELQAAVDETGTTTTYNNGGGQTGTRTNPDLKTLTDYQKLVINIIRTLIPLVPETTAEDGLAEFRCEALDV